MEKLKVIAPVISYPPEAVLDDVHVCAVLDIGERSLERLDIPWSYLGTRTRRIVYADLLAWIRTKRIAA